MLLQSSLGGRSVRTLCRTVALLTDCGCWPPGGRRGRRLPGRAACRALHASPPAKDRADLGNEALLSRRSAANFDTIGSWNKRIEMKLDMEQSIRHGKLIPQISLANVGVTSLIGRRRENEDRVEYVQVAPNIFLFAVYDGHGGAAAADYACEHMSRHVRFWLERGETDLQRVLRRSFTELNNAFTRHVYCSCTDVDQVVNSGTTATVCLLRNSVELVVAWVGDSRALMCRRGKVVRLTHDHKARDPAERRRVVAAGGSLTETADGALRVAGKLDMTRSIGDVQLKPYGVTSEPQVRSIEVGHGKDAFLILTTDGVNYVMNDQEIINVICTFDSVTDAAQFITDQALQFGSEDNCTAIIVPFGAWGKYAQSASTVQLSFGRNILGRRYI